MDNVVLTRVIYTIMMLIVAGLSFILINMVVSALRERKNPMFNIVVLGLTILVLFIVVYATFYAWLNPPSIENCTRTVWHLPHVHVEVGG